MTRFLCGLGMSAASLVRKSRGSYGRCVVPSDHGVLSEEHSPVGLDTQAFVRERRARAVTHELFES